MIRVRSALAAGALLLAPVAAHAQAQPKSTAPQPTRAQLERAAANLRIFVSALQSDKIPEAVKTALFACVYSNPFAKISEGTDKALAARKVSNTDPNMVVSAMAAICGFKPGQMGATPPAAPAPKKK